MVDEASEVAARPPAFGQDRLPFSQLGPERFEILTYLLMRDEEASKERASTVLLVGGSSDKGRDVLVFRAGALKKIVQCKNLSSKISRPAVVRELVKVMLHHSLAGFLQDGQEYELLAPGGLTSPAEELVARWPANWSEQEVRDAFDANLQAYDAFGGLVWTDLRDRLLTDYPKLIRISAMAGLALSASVKSRPQLFEQFFEVRVVADVGQVEEAIGRQFEAYGHRRIEDKEILRLVDAIRSYPPEQRQYLGVSVFGLTAEHYALMTPEEMTEFGTNCLSASIGNARVLMTVLTREAERLARSAVQEMTLRSGAFGHVLTHVITTRVLAGITELSMPVALRSGSPMGDFVGKTLDDVVEHFVLDSWRELNSPRQKFRKEEHPRGSRHWMAARIAEHLLFGVGSQEEHSRGLREDFARNAGVVAALDSRVCSLVPGRLIVVSDTLSPLDDPESIKLLHESATRVEDAKARRKEALGEGSSPSHAIDDHQHAVDPPTLEVVTEAPVEYAPGAYWRGYERAIIFRGYGFSESVEFTHRRSGEKEGHLFWRKVNNARPGYAEVSTGGDALEGPLSWMGYEFCLRNGPDAHSEWVAFSYRWDIPALLAELERCEREGTEDIDAGIYGPKQSELLRRAMVFSDRLLGVAHPRTLALRKRLEHARDQEALGKLRFRVGQRVAIARGDHEGKDGHIARLHLRAHHAYAIEAEGGTVWAADSEVELYPGGEE